MTRTKITRVGTSGVRFVAPRVYTDCLAGQLLSRRCAACENRYQQHGLCTDPFGDRQECYCFAQSEGHRLYHERWSRDDDIREGADGLDSSPTIEHWRYDEERAQDFADRNGPML